jgi:hypothetical protein
VSRPLDLFDLRARLLAIVTTPYLKPLTCDRTAWWGCRWAQDHARPVPLENGKAT